MKLICLLFGLVALSQAEIDWSKVRHMNLQVKPSRAIPFRPPVVNRPSAISIVNGDVAAPHQFPYQVAIVLTRPEGSFFCGGSLISKKYVLTAGHCADRVLQFELVIGSNHLKPIDSGSVIVLSNKSVVHPNYTHTAFEVLNDIAIIELPEEVELSDAIQLMKLPSRSQATNLFIGANSTISGWGKTHDNDTDISDDLRYVSNPVLSNEDCSAQIGYIHDTQICQSGAGIKGACMGDSGGPLTVLDDNGKRIQVGVASYGTGRGCEAGLAAAYTRVTSYLDFIEENSDVKIDP